jgi:hypothetical protein
MSLRMPQMNYKHRHLNQKGKNYTNMKQTTNQGTITTQQK